MKKFFAWLRDFFAKYFSISKPVEDPVTPPVSSIVRAPWLRDPAKYKEWCSFEWLRFSAAVRKEWISYIKARGGNSMFMTLSHTSAGITPYKSDGFGGPFDDDKLTHYRNCISELNANGITPMLCLFDDTPSFHKQSNEAEHNRFISQMIRVADGLQVRWCTGMEPEEYWTPEYADLIAFRLRGYGGRSIKPYVHTQRENFITENIFGVLHERNHPRDGREVKPASLLSLYLGLIKKYQEKEIWAWEWTQFQDECADQINACIKAGCKGVGQ